LSLEICAGGVHDQLWQKTPVEETGEIKFSKQKKIMDGQRPAVHRAEIHVR